MSLIAWLLWTLFRVTLAGPVLRAAPEGANRAKRAPDAAPSGLPAYYRLPVFQDVQEPHVAPGLLQLLHYKRPLPAELTALLLPPSRPQQRVQGTGTRAVEVWCGVDKLSVRVDRVQLRAWPVPSLFSLGSCPASRITPRYLYFHYGLMECDAQSQVVGGQLVYTFYLWYTPPPQGYVIRVLPLQLPIHCNYNRFHYSYQVGFRRQVQHTTFVKSIRKKVKLNFSLTVCNAEWKPLPPDHWFLLGEPVYFVAQTERLLAGERLYVDSCYVTSSKDPSSMPKVDIITNHGCITDSRREGSSSQFLLGEGSALKFSVDAFLFSEVSQELYLHCSMSVSLTTSHTSKSCNFNRAAGRWEELEAPPSVCSCCDSMCTDVQDSIDNTVSSPGWLIVQKDEEDARMRTLSSQANERRKWVDQDDKKEEMLDEHFKQIQTFPQETGQIGYEKRDEKAFPEETSGLPAEKKWKHSLTGSQQGKKERDEDETGELRMEKKGIQLRELATGSIRMSDKTRAGENNMVQAKVPSTKTVSETGWSGENSSDGPGTTTITTGNSHHSAAENISKAVTHITQMCSDSDDCSSNGTFKQERSSNGAGNGTMYYATGAEGFTPTGNSRLGSVWDSRVHGSPRGSRLVTLAGTPDMGHPGNLDVRQSKKRELQLEEVDTLLWSEQVKSVNMSVDTKIDGTPGRAGNSVSSKGPHGGDGTIHSQQIRSGSESVHSAHPPGVRVVDGLHGDSDFDSGKDKGEALHPSLFTGAVKTNKEVVVPEITFTRPHRVSSVNLEQMPPDSLSSAAVVTVNTALQGSESSPLLEWAEGGCQGGGCRVGGLW